MKEKVFVYGSLRQGFHNHRLLEDVKAKYLGIDFLPGTLISLGSFPALIPGTKPVEGEIYEVDVSALDRLDRLEGHPDWYMRKQAQTINSIEFVHYYELQRIPRGQLNIVQSGKWEGPQ